MILFVTAKTWKQPKCPSAEGWIKMRHIYTMEYCSAIERNKTVPFAETWIGLETVIQTEVSQKGKNKWSHINAHMWNLEKWYRWTYLQSRNRDTDAENNCMSSLKLSLSSFPYPQIFSSSRSIIWLKKWWWDTDTKIIPKITKPCMETKLVGEAVELLEGQEEWRSGS